MPIPSRSLWIRRSGRRSLELLQATTRFSWSRLISRLRTWCAIGSCSFCGRYSRSSCRTDQTNHELRTTNYDLLRPVLWPHSEYMRRFDSLSEREILALAISSEEEDERVYAD